MATATLKKEFKETKAFRWKDLGLSNAKVLELYRQMLLIRRFEERSAQEYGKSKIGGFCHLYIGQEAVGVGAIAALRETIGQGHGQGIVGYARCLMRVLWNQTELFQPKRFWRMFDSPCLEYRESCV